MCFNRLEVRVNILVRQYMQVKWEVRAKHPVTQRVGTLNRGFWKIFGFQHMYIKEIWAYISQIQLIIAKQLRKIWCFVFSNTSSFSENNFAFTIQHQVHFAFDSFSILHMLVSMISSLIFWNFLGCLNHYCSFFLTQTRCFSGWVYW